MARKAQIGAKFWAAWGASPPKIWGVLPPKRHLFLLGTTAARDLKAWPKLSPQDTTATPPATLCACMGALVSDLSGVDALPQWSSGGLQGPVALGTE